MNAAIAPRSSWSRPREREATRLAILDAAHRLIELNGEAALTLSAVAGEAGVARATIYSYFAGKRQLLSQLNGEVPEPEVFTPAPVELQEATSAPEEPPAEADEPEAATEEQGEPERSDDTAHEPQSATQEQIDVEAANEAPDEAPAEDESDVPVEPREEQKIDTDGEAARSAAEEESPDYSELMRRQAAALDGLAKRIMVPRTVLKEGTAAAIARLETRLHVVEQSVADVETRRGQDAKELGERLASLIDTMQRSEARLADLEKRQQVTLAELRLELHNLTTRMDGLAKAPESEPATVQDFQPWTNAPAPESAEPAKTSEESAPQTYLSSARRAAIDAAQQPVAEEEVKAGRGWAYWRWLVAVVIVAAGGLGFVLNMQRTDDAVTTSPKSEIVAQVVHQPQKPGLAALAKAGNAQAQLILGLKLLNGTGMAMHIDKAAGWLERAASKGQPVAQEVLGVLYQTGTGVAVDMSKAIKWYGSAAAAGNVKAMANLGKAYGGGWSDGTDLAKAAQWFARAAAFGDVDSAFNLAILYERGAGVPQNLPTAYLWYAIAASEGDKEAASRASIIATHLAPADLQAALQTAMAFKPSPASRAANDIPALSATIAMK